MPFLLLSGTFLTLGFLRLPPDDSSIERGRNLYLNYCSTCHGTDGKGSGPAAVHLFPKPRDFTTGTFKFQSTPVGSLPTDEDLFRTITNGMPGSGMPAWDRLPEQDRRDLVSHIKSLSPRFVSEQPSDIVVIDREPMRTDELVKAGKVIYALAGCGMCHGKTGAGDGPSAETLRDDLGRSIKPYNFTRARAFKGGDTPRDIYRTFSTGIGGTPMPGYGEDALTISRETVSDLSIFSDIYSQEELREFAAYISRWPAEERLNTMSAAERKALADERRWALVYYVISLSKSEQSPIRYTTADQSLQSFKVGNLAQFNDPLSSGWSGVKGVEFPLISLWQRNAPTDRVRVKSVTDGTTIAFRVEWDDPTMDDHALRSARFGDAAAIQFPLDPATDPFFGMGDTNFAVNIWHWKSWWERDQTSFAGLTSAFPDNAADLYPFDVGGGSLLAAYFAGRDTAASISMTWNAGWGSGNPLSAQRRRSPVEDLNARGFGTLTSQPTDHQNVDGKGIWREGTWRVVFTRSLSSKDRDDAGLTLGQTLPLSFGVWDGSFADRDGQKMVTNWYRLIIASQ